MTVKEDLLNNNRPLSDKIGSNAWGWRTKREIIESVHEAQLMGLKYLRYPYVISRTVTTSTKGADTWRYGLKAILDAGIIPIVDFYASDNGARPSGVVPDGTVSYFKTTIEAVINDNKGKGIVWESWNEAIGASWSKTPSTPEVMKQITDMHKFIADTVKTNDPDSAFIGPSLDDKQANYIDGIYTENGGGLYPYLKAYKDAGSFDIVDAVSIHPYSSIHNNGGNPEVFIKELSTYNNLSGNKPLIPTEFGYPVEITDPINSQQAVFSLHDARVKTLRQMLIMDMLGCPTILVDTLGSANNYNNLKIGSRNLYLNSKEIKDAGQVNGGAKVTVEPFDDTTNMWHIVAPQGAGGLVGIYLLDYGNGKLPNSSDWSYSADIKGTGYVQSFGIEAGSKNPVIGTVGSEWSRISQTGHFYNPQVKTIIMYFDTTNSPLNVYIKLPKLETGNMPTDWTPAPEDLASQAHGDTSLLNNIKLDGLEDDTSGGMGGKLTSVGEALTSFMTRIKGYTFKERLATTSYTAQGVIDDLYALRYTKEGSSDLMVYWSPIPNRYGVVATSPNVTHTLIFQDMPQIIAI